MTKVLIADNSVMAREGIKSILSECDDINVVGECEKSSNLLAKIKEAEPQILLIDYCSTEFGVNDILDAKKAFPNVGVLAISQVKDPDVIMNALKSGITSHILKHCSKDEIIDAIRSTGNGGQFYCSTLLGYLETTDGLFGCSGVNLSQREIEIIGMIADGQTNKEIAEKIFLSTHTVMTHRKNIMAKLGINNTAGIVIFAVKQNIIAPNKYLFSPTEAE